MDSAIQAANERMVYVTGDKEAIRAYEMRQMALSDYNSAINYARSTGMKKGRTEEKLDIARNLKKMGLPISQIADGTGLPIKTIEQLTTKEFHTKTQRYKDHKEK